MQLSKLALAIGITSELGVAIMNEEGYGIEGALPTRNNNPGDLEHAPGEIHDPGAPNAVGKFKTAEEGAAALNRQLDLAALRNWTVKQLVYVYAPPSENNSARYLSDICRFLKIAPDATVADALKVT